MNTPIRHGEVILKPVNKIPKGKVQVLDSFIAADSDAGHDHILKSKQMEVITTPSGAVCINVIENGTIIHQKEFDRHPDLPVIIGKYKVNKKTEYDMFDKVINEVKD
jgi:hypothetical protein